MADEVDCAEEQEMELEALEAIFMEDYTLDEGAAPAWLGARDSRQRDRQPAST